MDLQHYKTSIRHNWAEFWASSGRRIEFIFSFLLLTTVMLGMLKFLHYNETRPGRLLRDPLLAMIPPIDLSVLTFFLLYLGLISTIILLLPRPGRLLIGMQVYAIYAALRIVAMYIVPLEPPEGIIPLRDPLMHWAHTGAQLNKDLFFSGHTSTMFIFYMILPHGRARQIYLGGFLIMAACLIVQRVHYSIDVIAAPFFCFGAYAFVLRMRKLAGFANHL